MKHLKRIFLAFLVISMVICLPKDVTWAAEEQMTSDNMNFDVIFAIDGSGSMKKSDAMKLRLTAGRLFTELASSDTSRAGFVQFTNVIMDSAGLTDLSTEKNKEAFRNRLSGLKDSVKGTWDTDISLGLTEALKLLKEGESFGNDRNPVIILLSDGNTDLPSGPRTVEESNAELNTTLTEAAELGVPVYSIGLNWDGKLDVSYMQNIADQTGGAFYNIDTAAEFNQYMTDIFGNVADGDSEGLHPEYKDGRYETNFVIDNSSVLTANIVILTDKGVSDPKLTDPSGADVALDAEHGVIVTTDTSDANKVSTYTILKIMYPAQGAWKISVKGEADDAIQVNLLTTYDISFVLSSSKEPTAGESLSIIGKLIRDDKKIKDADLLSGASAVCTIIDNKGNVVGEDLPMKYNKKKSYFYYKTELDKSGNYYITANLKGKDGNFSKEAAQFQLTVNKAKLSASGTASVKLWCNPIKVNDSFNLGDFVQCESLSELTCTADDSDKNIVDVDYNKDTGTVNVKPLSTGKQTLELHISDEYGQKTSLSVEVKVSPSWIWFVAVIVILVIVMIIAMLIMKAVKPILKDKITIELSLPPMLMNLTPAPVTLSMPSKKSEVILGKLIQSDLLAQSTLGNPVTQSGLNGILGKIKLIACRGEGVIVKILPKISGMVMINGQTIETNKGMRLSLRKGDKLGIQYSADGQNISTVYLKIEQDGTLIDDSIYGHNDLGGFGAPFGGGSAGGFGGDFGAPFGGSTGGFGGDFGTSFGGGNAGGFGTPFGGESDSQSNQSGFDNFGNSNSNFNFGSDGSDSNKSDDGFGGFL